jgi:hypothetical protein
MDLEQSNTKGLEYFEKLNLPKFYR